MKLKQFLTKEKLNENFRLSKRKHRLVIMDSETFQERWSFQLKGMNTFIVVGISILGLIALTSLLIAFTPLRQYIPGYTRDEVVQQAYLNTVKIDSLQNLLDAQSIMLENVKKVIAGEDIPSIDYYAKQTDTNTKLHENVDYKRSTADSLLRLEIESADKYQLSNTSGSSSTNVVEANAKSSSTLKNYFFFTPVKGTVINGFDRQSKHLGIDIATQANESVKAILNGTVIFADWTVESGYVIAIQHSQNIVSIYKHNASLLRKTGDVLRAGEPIAFVGNSGEQTTGPHLHFELWHNGNPVNPREYIPF